MQHMLEVSEKLYNAATEAICSALTVCEDTDGYQPLAHILVAEVKKLAPVFQASILSEDVDRLVPLHDCQQFLVLVEINARVWANALSYCFIFNVAIIICEYHNYCKTSTVVRLL